MHWFGTYHAVYYIIYTDIYGMIYIDNIPWQDGEILVLALQLKIYQLPGQQGKEKAVGSETLKIGDIFVLLM
jgi:hypothetical protein